VYKKHKKVMLVGVLSFLSVLLVLVISPLFVAKGTGLVLSSNKERPNRPEVTNHDTSKFNPDGQLSKKTCGDKLGDPVIDVVQKVQNDVDSGFGSNNYFPGEANYWNVESYTRQIKVWKTGDSAWCAIVSYLGGRFNAFYNQTGPGGTGLIGADVNGEMRGGYRATFTGVLSDTPAWTTKGLIGTYDYKCDLHAACPGRVDWVAQYFPGYSDFAQPVTAFL